MSMHRDIEAMYEALVNDNENRRKRGLPTFEPSYELARKILANAKADRASQLMAFADHVYAASEPIPEDTMTAEDRKEQFGEECVYCGKDSWTCEHFQPEQEGDEPYSSRDEGRNPDGSGMSYGDRNSA